MSSVTFISLLMGFYLLCTQKAYANEDEFWNWVFTFFDENSLFKKKSQYNVIGYNKEDIFGHKKTASSFWQQLVAITLYGSA